MDGGFIQGIALQNISLMCRVVIHVRSKPPWNNSAMRTTTTANYTKIRPNGPYDTLYRVQRETRLRKLVPAAPPRYEPRRRPRARAHRMPYLSNMLSRFDGVLGASHTFHIFIASSAGQIVNNRVPHGLMHE